MFRKENSLAFSAIWFLVAVSVGYVFGHFLLPGQTTGSSGFLGLESEDRTFFNARIFLIVFSGVMLIAPVFHAIQRKMLIAGMEVVIIGLMVIAGWLLNQYLTVQESDDGFLWLTPSYTTTSFDAGILLSVLAGIWGLYVVIRYFLMRNPAKTRIYRTILLVLGYGAVMLYFIGMHRSIFHSTKFWIFEDEVSLIDSVTAFFKSGENFLGVVIITFTLIFPMIKFFYMFWGLLARPTPVGMKVTKILSVLGKYSMLDVFVVALLVLNLKFDSKIIDMQIREGAILFGFSIILNMVVTSALVLGKTYQNDETDGAV